MINIFEYRWNYFFKK